MADIFMNLSTKVIIWLLWQRAMRQILESNRQKRSFVGRRFQQLVSPSRRHWISNVFILNMLCDSWPGSTSPSALLWGIGLSIQGNWDRGISFRRGLPIWNTVFYLIFLCVAIGWGRQLFQNFVLYSLTSYFILNFI